MYRAAVTPVITAALGLLLAGCGRNPFSPRSTGSPPGIVFSVEGTRFAVDDTVHLSLDNASSRVLWYNLCTARLERREVASWVPVPRRPDPSVCLAALFDLGPGRTTAALQPVYSYMEPGRYRFRGRVYLGSDYVSAAITSNEFTVVRP